MISPGLGDAMEVLAPDRTNGCGYSLEPFYIISSKEEKRELNQVFFFLALDLPSYLQ